MVSIIATEQSEFNSVLIMFADGEVVTSIAI